MTALFQQGLLLALLLVTVYSGYEQQQLSHRDDVINIDEHGECVPDVSCKGIDIKEIPYISGKQGMICSCPSVFYLF